MRLATVDGETLTLALQQMAEAPRNMAGSAFWCFGEALVIKWTSYEQPIDFRDGVPLAGAVMVPGRAMKQLGATVEIEGDIEIQWEPERGRLRIGMHGVPATWSESEPDFVLPVDAQERDLLKQAIQWGSEATSRAGYGEEVAEVEVRWDESIRSAAADLRWTGLTAEILRSVLSEAICDRGAIRGS